MKKYIVLLLISIWCNVHINAQTITIENESNIDELKIKSGGNRVTSKANLLLADYQFSSGSGHFRKEESINLRLKVKNISSVGIDNVNIQLVLPDKVFGNTNSTISLLAANTEKEVNFSFYILKDVPGNSVSVTVQLSGQNFEITSKIVSFKFEEEQVKSYAFILTTSDYDDNRTWKSLPNSKEAGDKLTQLLKEDYKFEKIVHKNNINLDEFSNLLLQMKDVGENDQLLIYIASHGYFDGNFATGYLVFKNTLTNNTQQMFAHAQLAQIIDHFPSKHILIIIDACYSSTFDYEVVKAMTASGLYSKGNKTTEQYINDQKKIKSRLYLTSGETQTGTGSSTQAYSPFSSSIIERLQNSNYKSEGLIDYNILRNDLEQRRINPTPRGAGFGSNQTGSNFLFIVK
jgi:hypothetical protein